MKIMALDIREKDTGTAISDGLGFAAKPYLTVKTAELIPFLAQAIEHNDIETIIIGYPFTIKKTKKILARQIKKQKKLIEEAFSLPIRIWDQELTSEEAENFKQCKLKKSKQEIYSLEASFILQTFLAHHNTNKVNT